MTNIKAQYGEKQRAGARSPTWGRPDSLAAWKDPGYRPIDGPVLLCLSVCFLLEVGRTVWLHGRISCLKLSPFTADHDSIISMFPITLGLSWAWLWEGMQSCPQKSVGRCKPGMEMFRKPPPKQITWGTRQQSAMVRVLPTQQVPAVVFSS